MNRLPALALLPLSLCLSMPLHAQDAPKASPEEAAMMEAYQKAGTPGLAHAGLAMTAGEYSVLIKSWSTPDAPPSESIGTASRKVLLGGRVVSEDLQSSMYGQPYTGFGLTGFDNVPPHRRLEAFRGNSAGWETQLGNIARHVTA